MVNDYNLLIKGTKSRNHIFVREIQNQGYLSIFVPVSHPYSVFGVSVEVGEVAQVRCERVEVIFIKIFNFFGI